MVKRILLILLCVFAPMFAHADDTLELGRDLDEKNIPLDVNVMESAFNLAFGDAAEYEQRKARFYEHFYNDCDVPFSVRTLYQVCTSSTFALGTAESVPSARCADFVRYYINGVTKTPIYYKGKEIKIDKKSKDDNWQKFQSGSENRIGEINVLVDKIKTATLAVHIGSQVQVPFDLRKEDEIIDALKEFTNTCEGLVYKINGAKETVVAEAPIEAKRTFIHTCLLICQYGYEYADNGTKCIRNQ